MISLHQSPSTKVHPAPFLTPGFLQALTILQMPILELSSWMQKQLENNPLVEVILESPPLTSTRVIERRRVVEQRDCSKEKTLHEHLESQARLFFHDPQELQKALDLLASIDEKGFLPSDTSDSPLLTAFQNFDPPGICARSLKESLLIQLRIKGRIGTLAFKIIENSFDDLLLHRLGKIRKQLRCTAEELYEILHSEIASLSFNPASRFATAETPLLIPDLYLLEEEGVWRVEINKTHFPRIKLNTRYLKNEIASSEETRDYLRGRYKEASSLLLAVRRRSATLARLGQLLLRTQRRFLEGLTRRPCYLNVKEVARELNLHPATVARIIANKMISCSYSGIVPLKFFFCRSSEPMNMGDTIASLISKESSLNPLSDQEIAEKLHSYGLPCARRTVAKYRKQLKIPASPLRKI